MAVLFGLKTIASAIYNTNIKLNIDNTAVVYVIKHMGTSHNWELNLYVHLIWDWAIQHQVWLFPVYVASHANLADAPSRKIYIDAEWKLCPKLFQKIVRNLDFSPTIDLFATRLNIQLERYVSYQPDPQAIGTDAFTLSWHNEQLHCFPPFSCVNRCLQKIQREKATGIIIAPKWPTQPFYPVLQHLQTL